MNLRTLTDVDIVERVVAALHDVPSVHCYGIDDGDEPTIVHESDCQYANGKTSCCDYDIETGLSTDHCPGCNSGGSDGLEVPHDVFELLDELRHRLLAPAAATSPQPERSRTGEDESAGAARAASDAMAPCTCAGVVPWHETGCPREEQWTPEHAADALVASVARRNDGGAA